MARFVALMRGVNVGGKMLSMETLRRLAVELGWNEVSTYIQSGNLLFSSAGDPSSDRLEQAIEERFGLHFGVIMCSEDMLHSVIDQNPFAAEASVEPKTVHLTLLSKTVDLKAPSLSSGPKALPVEKRRAGFLFGREDIDRFVLSERAVYLHCPGGYGRSKLTNSYWERKLGVASTTRNWSTVNKLAELLAQPSD